MLRPGRSVCGTRAGVGLAGRWEVVQTLERIDEAQPALEALLGTMLGADTSADRPAVEPYVQPHAEQPVPVGGVAVIHKATVSRSRRPRVGELPELGSLIFDPTTPAGAQLSSASARPSSPRPGMFSLR